MDWKSRVLACNGWEAWNSLAQAFFAAGAGVFGLIREPRAGQTPAFADAALGACAAAAGAPEWLLSAPYYFCFLCLAAGASLLSSALAAGRLRSALAVLHIALCAFLVPMATHALGAEPAEAAAASVAYVVLAAAISPLAVGAAAVAAGVAVAFYQRSYYLGVVEAPMADLGKIVAAYVGLAALGHGWRLLAIRLYQALIATNIAKDPAIPEEAAEELEALKRDNQLLKDEIALHIVEIRDIVAKGKG